MKWELDRAWDWHHNRPWLCGFNYVPSTAVNTTEFWQAESFDPITLDRELGWAGAVGLNTCRVFTQYLVWEADPDGFLARLGQFLDIADRRGLSVMVCLFDDCAFSGKQPYLGRQDDPIPGVHNSGWTPSPGHARVVDRAAWPALERYVTGVVSRFAGDARIVAWDLYNEPGNSDLRARSLPLLERAFEWARGCGPSQPLTVGIWTPELPELNEFALQAVRYHQFPQLRRPGQRGSADRRVEDTRPARGVHRVDAPYGRQRVQHAPAVVQERRCGMLLLGIGERPDTDPFPVGFARRRAGA